MNKMTWFQFAEALRGWAVISAGNRQKAKWELYHTLSAEEVWAISERKHSGYHYIEKPGWSSGKLVDTRSAHRMFT